MEEIHDGRNVVGVCVMKEIDSESTSPRGVMKEIEGRSIVGVCVME